MFQLILRIGETVVVVPFVATTDVRAAQPDGLAPMASPMVQVTCHDTPAAREALKHALAKAVEAL